MTEQKYSDIEKLRVLISHWLQHNESHGEEYAKWADVARKVEASQGMICRIRGTNSASLEGDNGPDYTMEYSSAKQKRTDGYKDGQIIAKTLSLFEQASKT